MIAKDIWLRSISAEVIKIEHPIRGDDTRAWGPPYAKYLPNSGKEGPGESAYYLSVGSSFLSLAPTDLEIGQSKQEIHGSVVSTSLWCLHLAQASCIM
jgi:hypothetical protein